MSRRLAHVPRSAGVKTYDGVVFLLKNKLNNVSDVGCDLVGCISNYAGASDSDVDDCAACNWDDCQRKARNGDQGREFGRREHCKNRGALEREWSKRER